MRKYKMGFMFSCDENFHPRFSGDFFQLVKELGLMRLIHFFQINSFFRLIHFQALFSYLFYYLFIHYG